MRYDAIVPKRRRNEPQALCPSYRLRALLDGQLLENVLYVRLHGFRRDLQRPRNLLVRISLADHRQDHTLSRAQRRGGPRRRGDERIRPKMVAPPCEHVLKAREELGIGRGASSPLIEVDEQ